ncbi:hypothetical protein [Variovorax sp. HJSM1_2]|uniref:hypothetical protein n=1 Tax=Variovorax sp. HJSM1_2 TaxID=3366263 RepID=UPI003BBFF6E1
MFAVANSLPYISGISVDRVEASDADAPRARRRGYTEISSTVLPTWDRAVPGTAARALNGSLNGNTDMPASRLEFSHWAHERGGAGVALGVVQTGTGSAALNGPAEVRDASANGSNVELGLRWRSSLADQRRLDLGAWRRVTNNSPDAYTLTQTSDGALYAARVEVQFPSAKYGGLAPEFGAIGMQMNGGGKVVLRAKRGGPMLYYRSNF